MILFQRWLTEQRPQCPHCRYCSNFKNVVLSFLHHLLFIPKAGLKTTAVWLLGTSRFYAWANDFSLTTCPSGKFHLFNERKIKVIKYIETHRASRWMPWASRSILLGWWASWNLNFFLVLQGGWKSNDFIIFQFVFFASIKQDNTLC